ncbi:CD39 [Mytilus edulis]|uniref:ENTPD1_3_8 n=1 Tax=Mytilus edulis TaxID=6550 RepID=A0A8S3TNR2_MYTED|nr:CD39 [Mytilus edulis]
MVHPLKLKLENKWNLEGPEDNSFRSNGYGRSLNTNDLLPWVKGHSSYGLQCYLCFGINEIERKYKALLVKSNNYSSTIPDPCGPSGHTTIETYTDVFEAPCTKADKIFMADDGEKNRTYELIGSSNNTQCSAMVSGLFNFGAGCGFSECSFNGSYQAPVHGEFYAFSNFFYEMDFLNLTKNSSEVSLSDYTSELTSLCSSPWSKVKYMKAANAEFLPWYCFRGHYILSLLTSGYKFNDTTWRNIKFLNKVNKKTEIGWSLGFMISSSTSIPATIPEIMISNLAFIMLCVLFIIFMILEVYKSKNVELIAAQINITDTKSLVIISAYRPPNKNDIDYLKQMIIEINELKLKFKNSTFWLGGDFNLPDIKWSEQNISGSMYSKELNEAFIDMLNNLGIEQMVDFPTRKDNILDLFCTNQPALITKIKSIPGISDHDIVLVDAICKPQRSKQSQHKIYLWKKVDIKKIKDVTSHFISELISQTNENLNIDQLWNKFKEGSNKIIDDNVPSKITKSKYTNPWANRDIDHLCKKTT